MKKNNENLLTQYKEKIAEITEDKGKLLSQNKELLEQLEVKNEEKNDDENLADLMEEEEEKEKQEKIGINYKNSDEINYYKNENQLFKEEIKSLKEQLSNQANELTELKTLKKNIEKLKFENEELSNANKELKNNLEKEKQNKLTKKDSLTDVERQDSSAKLVSTFRKVSGLASLLNKESSKIELAQKEKDFVSDFFRVDQIIDSIDFRPFVSGDVFEIKFEIVRKDHLGERIFVKQIIHFLVDYIINFFRQETSGNRIKLGDGCILSIRIQ